MLGGTGSAGRATVDELLRRGCDVVCFVRSEQGPSAAGAQMRLAPLPAPVELRFGDVKNLISLERDGFRGERFDAVISCLTSRTGAPDDAWAIDHGAHLLALQAAEKVGVGHFVLVSAVCVQRPRLAFQHAKLAFEQALICSGMRYSVVRPTAFFKSLSGQIDRVRQGKPFLIFGDGTLTACKPISDEDLAGYVVDCLDDPARWDKVLPIGGPGPAITPREQGERLFALLHSPPRFQRVPVALLDAIAGGLSLLGRVWPALAAKAELARIGRYYATESMLVINPETGRYDAEATPATGTRTLFEFYAEVLAGAADTDLGAHAVFGRRR